MNVILNGQQSDTKAGALSLPASVNLTGLECSLVKLVNNAGVLNFALPTAVTDEAFFVLGSGDIAGNNVVAEPPALNDNCRVLADATNAINPGDLLSLSPNTWGRLYKPLAGAGAGFYTFIAEEAAGVGAVGQLLKVRRIPDRSFNL
jgi:hypothetical protein